MLKKLLTPILVTSGLFFFFGCAPSAGYSPTSKSNNARSIASVSEGQVTNNSNTKRIVKVDSVKKLVQHAKQGGRVQIAAGAYTLKEPLTLSNNVELIGAGKDKTFIISSAQGHVVKFEGEGTFVAKGISFEHTGDAWADVVRVTKGGMDIENCRFSSGVWNDDERKGGDGLWVTGQAQGVVKNSIFENNDLHGVDVADEAKLKLEKNILHNNEGGGIVYFGNSSGEATGNTSKGNGVGIGVRDAAQPRIEQNILHDNRTAGIAYVGNSGGIASNNSCKGNIIGIGIIGEPQPKLENNSCDTSNF